MCEMERGEPSLVPQWYKLTNGSTTSNARLNQISSNSSTSRHSDENGIGFSSRNSLLCDLDRKSSSLKRSFSSNGSISGKSQAYSSFRRSSREKNQEKSFHSRNRENRSILIDDPLFDHDDLSIGARTEKDALRRSQSMTTERQGDTWSKRIGNTVNNGGASGVNILGAGKTAFEKDFPSLGLGAEERQGNSALGCISSFGLRTAVQSLPVGPPVIIGTSALAEVPIKLEVNGLGLSSTLQTTPSGQVYTTSNTSTGLNMAEALAQAPSLVRSAPQSSIDTQRIEELTLRKCKQLIPVTPSMPKTLSNSEKSKSKGSRAVELSAVNKIVQQSAMQLLSHVVPSPTRSDIAKASQSGTLQVLNRDKNGISNSNKDAPVFGKALNPGGFVLSAPVSPLKSSVDQKLKVDCKGTALSSTQSSLGERKPLSQARDRNDFFNLLRKKSSGNSNTLSEPNSDVCSSTLEKSGAKNSASTSLGDYKEDGSLSAILSSNCSMENGACANGGFHFSDESELPEDDETNPYSDPVDDPEEEAFLQSLGWDKNVREEALTKEEIDEFLKKYEKQRPLKMVFQLQHNGVSELRFSASSS